MIEYWCPNCNVLASNPGNCIGCGGDTQITEVTNMVLPKAGPVKVSVHIEAMKKLMTGVCFISSTGPATEEPKPTRYERFLNLLRANYRNN